MIVCPLCEHTQAQGDECEVCGRRFPAGVAVPVPVAPVEGLEATGHAPVHPAAEQTPDLEATRFAAAQVAPEVTPDIEATRAAPVAAVPLDVVPDLERISDGLPADEGVLLPPLPVCRYCRTPAGPDERICSRCGMRLPVFAVAPAVPAAEEGRVCGCGARVRGQVCPACGARR
ncbi:MAG: hypothetical protein QM767_16490 [Anaeromyxobacter sp.]